MQIIQKPTPYSFAGNILDIVVNSDVDVEFMLILDGVEQLRERYSPDGGDRVVIRLRDIVDRITPEASIEAGVIDIPTYTYRVGNLPMETFRCIRGGHGAPTDAATFMRSNWLSWQPQSRTTGYHTPQRLCYAALADCTVKVRGYFADNSTEDVDLQTLLSDKLYTIDTTFGTIRGRFGKQPTSFDIWVEGGGVRSYTQRYYITSDGANDDVFMWYGSLGGIETAIFTGDRVEKNEIESMAAVFDDKEIEFDRNGKKLFAKYTGYIASDNTRLWLLDFFNSIHRYHIDGGALRRVVVSKPKLEHTRGELAGYEFTFAHSAQSKYINLPRAETPAVLEVGSPEGELFFLAPRLNEFSRGEFGAGDILIPCQYAAGGDWLSVALIDILEGAHGGGGGGGGVTKVRGDAPIGVVKSGDTYTISHHIMPPTDVFGHSGTADRYGHCIRDPHPYGGDTAIPFTALNVASDVISSLKATPAMVGYGNAMVIDPDTGRAHLWTDHIHARQSFETMEMRYRKMIVSGEELVVNNGAVVEAVQAVGWGYLVARDGRAIVTQRGEYILVPNFAGDDLLTFTVKGEHGIDYQQFEPHDILRYTWRDSTTGVSGASGYIEVMHALSEFLYVGRVIEGSPEWLAAGMTLALWGNTVNPDRQGFIVLSARERTIAIYDGVRSSIIDASNLRVLLGRLDHVVDIAFSPEALRGCGLYASNCYLSGDFLLRSTGRSIDTELSIRDGVINAQAERITLQGETITAQARQIELKADQVLVDGLLTVNGQIRADKIDVDSLVTKKMYADILDHHLYVGGSAWGPGGIEIPIVGIAVNPRYNSGETERNNLQADFFLGIQNVGGGILTISKSGSWGEFIKVDRTGYFAYLDNVKRTIISTSQIRIQSKNNDAFFEAKVNPSINNMDLKLYAKGLPLKSQAGSGIPWGALYINRNTGQIYSE